MNIQKTISLSFNGQTGRTISEKGVLQSLQLIERAIELVHDQDLDDILS